MNTHQCIKCKENYQDEDEEAYLCGTCLRLKNKIAEEVDRKMGSTVGQQPQSDLTRYDSLTKGRGGFVNAKDFLQ